MPSVAASTARLVNADDLQRASALREVLSETALPRMLDDEVLGRAYGLALPTSWAASSSARWWPGRWSRCWDWRARSPPPACSWPSPRRCCSAGR